MSVFNGNASVPRFKPLMRCSEKLVTYPTLFLLGGLAVLLLMQNTAQAATPGDPLEDLSLQTGATRFGSGITDSSVGEEKSAYYGSISLDYNF